MKNIISISGFSFLHIFNLLNPQNNICNPDILCFINLADMIQHSKKYESLKLPIYPGGKKAFQEFIAKNVRYPKEAENANIEGGVIVGYEINDNGMVQNPHIIKGLGYGCDEEAIRVIGLLRYEKVKNKRVRVKLTTQTTIHFHLNQLRISYTVTETASSVIPAKAGTEKPEAGSEPKSSSTSYSYTIDL
jgi:TonB family protein